MRIHVASLSLLLVACGNPTQPSPPDEPDLAVTQKPPDLATAVDLAVGCTSSADCPVQGGIRRACCGGTCVDVSADPKNCGACNAACAGAKTCCDGNCVDTQTDALNCGGCGMTCTTGANAKPACAAGQCAIGACVAGWGDCDKDPANGCETNLRVDPMNCTACGMTCSIPRARAQCADGCYMAACEFGWDDCNLDPADGCEKDVTTDIKNCGACGNPCLNKPHAKNTCIASACIVTSCDLGYADCNNDGSDGCEVAVGSDAKNCGKCGNVCPQGLVCINGGCTCPQCNYPNAVSKCVNNQCILDHCNPGFTDCDMQLANGCEVATGSDIKNCGGCGNVCPMNLPGCVNGQCVMSPCLGNPLWMQVQCVTPDWVWSSDRNKAQTVAAAAAARVLETGCNHATPQPQEGMGLCSLDGKGWISTKTFTMQTCDTMWWHLGGRYSGACGGHNGDTYRHLVLTENDCFAY